MTSGSVWTVKNTILDGQPDSRRYRRDSFFRATGATHEALIAAFCRLDESLSHCREKGWLVGAVGIENSPTPIKPCKQWCCNHPRQDNHYNHYKYAGPTAQKILYLRRSL
jgi:hypothetical protein